MRATRPWLPQRSLVAGLATPSLSSTQALIIGAVLICGTFGDAGWPALRRSYVPSDFTPVPALNPYFHEVGAPSEATFLDYMAKMANWAKQKLPDLGSERVFRELARERGVFHRSYFKDPLALFGDFRKNGVPARYRFYVRGDSALDQYFQRGKALAIAGEWHHWYFERTIIVVRPLFSTLQYDPDGRVLELHHVLLPENTFPVAMKRFDRIGRLIPSFARSRLELATFPLVQTEPIHRGGSTVYLQFLAAAGQHVNEGVPLNMHPLRYLSLEAFTSGSPTEFASRLSPEIWTPR